MAGKYGRTSVNAASSIPKTAKLNTSAVTKVSVDALVALSIDEPPDDDLQKIKKDRR